MENVYDFPDRAVIEEQAAAWIIKLDGEAPPTAEQLLALHEWMARSPVHRQEIIQLAEFWGKMNILTELAVPLGKTESRLRRDQKLSKKSFAGAGLGLAAACVIAIISVMVVYFVPDYKASNGLYSTAVGQQSTTILADGSSIQLNTNSQLEVNYREGYRDIRLIQGEAFFEVAKDPDRPFRVYAGNGRVQAIGTAFSVYINGEDVDVLVTEGRVGLVTIDKRKELIQRDNLDDDSSQTMEIVDRSREVSYEKELGVLDAGQRTKIINKPLAEQIVAQVEILDEREMNKELAWRTGLLTFSGDTLEEVVAVISRYTPVSIQIPDPKVRAIKIGGQFKVGETEAMLDSLEVNFGLNIKRVGYNQVELSL